MIKCKTEISQAFSLKRLRPDESKEEALYTMPKKIPKRSLKPLQIIIPEVPEFTNTVVQSASEYADFQKTGSQYAIVSKKGNFRRSNQDRCVYSPIGDIHLFAVFDGYGSDQISQLSSEYITTVFEKTSPRASLKQRMADAVQMLITKLKNHNGSMEKIGTTACICIKRNSEICIANIGDSGAGIINKSGEFKLITSLHNIDNTHEKERIEKKGGVFLYGGGKMRLQGELAVTRSIGSYNLHPYLSDEPEIIEAELGDEDSFLVLCTDGVLQFIHPQTKCNGDSPIEISWALHNIATTSGSQDNMSTVTIGI